MDFVHHIQNDEVVCLCEAKCDDTDMHHVKQSVDNIAFDIVYTNKQLKQVQLWWFAYCH